MTFWSICLSVVASSFTKTKGMKALLEERQRRRAAKEAVREDQAAQAAAAAAAGKPAPTGRNELAELVAAVRSA